MSPGLALLAALSLALAQAAPPQDAPRPGAPPGAPQPAPSPPQGAPVPAPQPVAAHPPAVQKLDAGLKDAFRLLNEGDIGGGRAAVAAYLEQRGDDALLYQAEFLLGYSYQKQKVYAAASEHFVRATELAPDYHPTWQFLGYARYYLGDLAGAREAFEAHLRLVPEEGDSWFGLGLIDFDEDRLDDAEQHFRKAIELHEAVRSRDPSGRARSREVAKARARLADVLIRRDDFPAARDELQQAAALLPAPEIWHKLHDVLLRLGDEAGAAQALLRRDEARAQMGTAGAASEDSR
jgi:tetratricopeptide (TPR) repeat protein